MEIIVVLATCSIILYLSWAIPKHDDEQDAEWKKLTDQLEDSKRSVSGGAYGGGNEKTKN